MYVQWKGKKNTMILEALYNYLKGYSPTWMVPFRNGLKWLGYVNRSVDPEEIIKIQFNVSKNNESYNEYYKKELSFAK